MIITSLITKLEQTILGDRELDIDIWRALDPVSNGVAESKVPLPWLYCYTTSIDSAVSLASRTLPGWTSCVQIRPNISIGYVHNNELAFTGAFTRPNPKREWYEVRHPNGAIALCIAVLQAHQAEQGRLDIE